MTGLLHDVLRDRAETTPAPYIDPDLIIGRGERRLWRRRATTGIASLAVAGLVAAGATALPDLFPERDSGTPAHSTGGFTERKVGFAVRDVIHYGGRSFAVGADVASYVQTDDGFVFTTPDGDVWFFDGTGSERIGSTGKKYGYLRADDTGSLVAWVTLTEDGAPQYVVYDTNTRSEVRVDDTSAGPGSADDIGGAYVYAVDGGSAYWRNENGIVRYDVAAGETTLLTPWREAEEGADGAVATPDLLDVADGRLAFDPEGVDASTVRVGDSFDADAPALPFGWYGVLSPSATHIAVEEGDEAAVFDTATRRDVTPTVDGYPFTSFYGWVDDDTVMVFAIEDLGGSTYPADFLACDVPTNGCTVVGSAQVAEGSFAVPNGQRVG
jgi:hypothetical protein